MATVWRIDEHPACVMVALGPIEAHAAWRLTYEETTVLPIATITELIQDDALGDLVNRRRVGLVGLATPQRTVRTLLRGALAGRIGAAQLDDVVLVADELVGNAVQHGGGPVEFTLDIYEQGATVRVADRGTDIDTVPVIAPDLTAGWPEDKAESELEGMEGVAEGGRGLLLVHLLSTTWSVERTEAGKAVMALFLHLGGDL